MENSGIVLAPVDGDIEKVSFQFPFQIEGKALGEAPTVEILEDGDLIIEGWASEFEGNDRQGENFAPDAFERSIKGFLDGSAPLCYHHKHDKVLGKVLDLEEVKDRGLRMRARVDGAIKDHPELGAIYHQIKKGTLNALSVGGFFRRKLTGDGPKICDMDFLEISVTGVPVHPKPAFAVVAGKALDDFPVEPKQKGKGKKKAEKEMLRSLDGALSSLEAVFEGKASKPKAEPEDLYTLALLLRLEQETNRIISRKDDNGQLGEVDAKVDALVVRVNKYLDSIAREVHALAAECGPLPHVPVSMGY